MFIRYNKDRIFNFLLSIIVFLILATMRTINNLIYPLFDMYTTQFFKNLNNLPTFLNKLLSFLSNPITCWVWLFIMCFFLWGMKHKVFTAWLGATFISGEIILKISKLLSSQHVSNYTAKLQGSFPSAHVFSLFMIIIFLDVLVVRFIDSAIPRIILRTVLLILIVLVALARVSITTNPDLGLDVIAAGLLAFAWTEGWKFIYYHGFTRLARFRAFVGTDI